MAETKLQHDPWEWEEAVYLGHARFQAQGCGGFDLDDVTDVNEAIERWNAHVRERHD